MIDDILVEIKSSISKVMNISPSAVQLEYSLADDIEADSIDMYSIAVMLEEDLDISITDEEVMSFKTVQDIYNLVKQKKT